MPIDTVIATMAKIRSIHEDAQLFAFSELNDDALIAYLETTDVSFRSIAYEGASMARGLLDISKGTSLDHWSAYLMRTGDHAIQVYIGLGWALAQRQAPISSFIKDLSPLVQARVYDGYGYYEGTFRNRTSVRDKIIPEEIKGNDIHAYDQGVGRCLWYMSKGNTVQLLKLIEGFSDSRKPHLWRGIGIAAAYVGGMDASMLISLLNVASPYQIQLATGAVLLARARAHADTPNSDAELTCRSWCHISADEAVDLMDKTEPKPATAPDSYIFWISRIEDTIRQSVNL